MITCVTEGMYNGVSISESMLDSIQGFVISQSNMSLDEWAGYMDCYLAVSLGTKARVMWFDPFYETIADGGKFDLATFHRFIQKINGVCKTKEFSSVSSVTFEFIIMKDHTKFGKHWLDTRNQCDAPSQHLPVSVAPRQHFL